jgi:hypothetical protein
LAFDTIPSVNNEYYFMLKLHLASTILALKHSWLVLQHKERRHWTNNFMVYSSNLLLNRCFPCFMVYVLHTWYCFCLKNSLLFLLIKKIKFGDSWVITFLILSGCYFNVFSCLVEMSLINRLFFLLSDTSWGFTWWNSRERDGAGKIEWTMATTPKQ